MKLYNKTSVWVLSILRRLGDRVHQRRQGLKLGDFVQCLVEPLIAGQRRGGKGLEHLPGSIGADARAILAGERGKRRAVIVVGGSGGKAEQKIFLPGVKRTGSGNGLPDQRGQRLFRLRPLPGLFRDLRLRGERLGVHRHRRKAGRWRLRQRAHRRDGVAAGGLRLGGQHVAPGGQIRGQIIRIGLGKIGKRRDRAAGVKIDLRQRGAQLGLGGARRHALNQAVQHRHGGAGQVQRVQPLSQQIDNLHAAAGGNQIRVLLKNGNGFDGGKLGEGAAVKHFQKQGGADRIDLPAMAREKRAGGGQRGEGLRPLPGSGAQFGHAQAHMAFMLRGAPIEKLGIQRVGGLGVIKLPGGKPQFHHAGIGQGGGAVIRAARQGLVGRQGSLALAPVFQDFGARQIQPPVVRVGTGKLRRRKQLAVIGQGFGNFGGERVAQRARIGLKKRQPGDQPGNGLAGLAPVQGAGGAPEGKLGTGNQARAVKSAGRL